MQSVDRPSPVWLASQVRWTRYFDDAALQQIGTLVGPLFTAGARNLVPDGGLDQPVYLVADGWSYSYHDLSDGRRHVIDIHPPGDIVGVAAACDRSTPPRLGSLSAVTAARVDGAQLRRRMQASGELARGVGLLLAAQQTDLTAHLGSVARHTAYERVGVLLLRLCRRVADAEPGDGRVFACPVSQQVMGDMLGLSVVHVNRSLRRLAEDGILHKRASDVEVLDAQALRRLGT